MQKPLSFRPSAGLFKLAGQLKADQKGGLMMIAGLAIVPMTFLVGFGVDYSRAMSLQTQLNAAADAAALAAVAPSMILQSDSEASAAATKMFNAQAALLTGYQDLQVTPTVTSSTSGGGSGALGRFRKVSISYTVKSINVFGGVLGADTLTVSGTSTASAAQPPNVDFYLAMDNSPSMLLPATSDGISKIIAATKTSENANGCAFACHAQVPHSDNIYVKDKLGRHVLLSEGYYNSSSSNKNVFYLWDQSAKILYNSAGVSMNTSTTNNGVTTTVTYSLPNWDYRDGAIVIQKTTKVGSAAAQTVNFDTGYWADGYWLTHNYGQIYGSPTSLVLRKDDVVSAASQLIPFASAQAAQYHVTYQAQMFSFDWTRSGNTSPVRTLNSLTDVTSYGSGFSAASLFPADDYWWKNSMPTSSTNIDDKATEVTNMLTTMKNLIPTAGTGAPGATPQKILFIITDGMLDQPNGGGRYFGPMRSNEITECTAIKAKGIKIAILYTQYLPESLAGDSWSQNNVAPLLPAPPSPYPAGKAGSSDQVLTALKSCASAGTNGTPLVQTVTADDNITTALQLLFSTALQTARLVQ